MYNNTLRPSTRHIYMIYDCMSEVGYSKQIFARDHFSKNTRTSLHEIAGVYIMLNNTTFYEVQKQLK